MRSVVGFHFKLLDHQLIIFKSTKNIFRSNSWLNFDGFLWFLIWFNFECQFYEFAYFWKGSKSFDYCLLTQDTQSESLESVRFIEKLNICLMSWWFYKNSLRLTMITRVSPTNCWSASRKSSSNRKLVINTIPY